MSKECAMYGNQCEDCPIKEICWYLFDLPFGRSDTDAYLKIYQQGRADVLREHREQCQGKCFKCEVSAGFVNSDGEEVKLPYSYSYKTDCEDNRYIDAREVLLLINKGRADAIDKVIEYLKAQFLMQNNPNSKFVETIVLDKGILDVLEKLKEQN